MRLLFCLVFLLQLGLLQAQELIPCRKNHLWGYADSTGRVVIAPAWDRVYRFDHNGYALVEKQNLLWVIDRTGNVKTPSGYTSIGELHNGRVVACRGGGYNWIQGEIVGGKWGYLDENFEEIIPFVYARAQDFEGNYAIVQENNNWGNWGVIDREGRVVLPFRYPSYSFDMRPFPGLQWHFVKEQLQADVSGKGEKWKIIDISGKQVGPPQGELHGIFQKTTASDRQKTDEALRKAGQQKTSALAANNHTLQTAAGPVRVTGTAWCIRPGFYLLQADREGKPYGLINEKNEVIIPFEYSFISPEIHDGRIMVKKNGLYGFCNAEGREVIPCKYPGAENFHEGLAVINLSARETGWQYKGVIDTRGHEYFESDPSFSTGPHHTLTDENGNERTLPDPYGKPDDVQVIGNRYLLAKANGQMAVFDFSLNKKAEGQSVQVLSPSRAMVTYGHFYRLVDLLSGQTIQDSLVVQSWNDHSTPTHPQFMENKTRWYGALDLSGNIVLPFVYTSIYAMGPTHFIVTDRNGRTGIVDSLNRTVREFSAETVSVVSIHLAAVYDKHGNCRLYDVRNRQYLPHTIAKMEKTVNVSLLQTGTKKTMVLNHRTESVYATEYLAAQTFYFRETGSTPVALLLMKKAGGTLDIYNTETGACIFTGAQAVGPERLPLLAIRCQDVFQLYNANGQLMHEGRYTDVQLRGTDFMAVQAGGKWGVLNAQLGQVLDLSYDAVSEYNSGHFVVVQNGRYGLVNEQKQQQVRPVYTHLTHAGFSQEKGAVWMADKNGKKGLIDSQDHVLVDFVLDDDYECGYNSMIAFIDRKPCVYDYSGTCRIPPGFDRIERFEISDPEGNDLYIVHQKGQLGLMNDQGRTLLPCAYDNILPGNEYYYGSFVYFFIEQKGKKGMAANDGKISIPVIYDDLVVELPDDIPYVLAKKGGKTGLYRNFTRQLLVPTFDQIIFSEDDYYNGYIRVKSGGLYGIIDTAGKVLASPQYSSIRPEEISDGYLLRTRRGNKHGLMDTKGNVLLRAEFDEVRPEYDFDHTAYRVRMGKTYGLYDYLGRLIVPCNYTRVLPGDNDRWVMVFSDKSGKQLGVSGNFSTGEVLPEE